MFRKLLIVLFIFIVPPAVCYSKVNDEKILKMVDTALDKLLADEEVIPDNIRRVSFYSIRIDKGEISKKLYRQIKGRIESKFMDFKYPAIVYTPEIKPVRIKAKDGSISFSSSFQNTSEIQQIAGGLKLDGFLEGSLCIASNKVFINLRIFDSETMAVVWSKSVDSIIPEAPPEPPDTGIDYGFGFAGLYMTEVNDTGISIPVFAKYGCANMRIAQKLTRKSRLFLTLTGSAMYLAEGIKSDKSTMVSSSSGKGIFSILACAGIRIPVVPVKIKEKLLNRDWLATEFKIGTLWGVRGFSTGIFGLKLESDLTKDLSVSAGISYAGIKNVSFTDGGKVRTGGLFYEVSLLQFNCRP